MSISEHYITDREILEEQEYSYKWEQQEIGGVLMPALILTTPPLPGEPIIVGRKYGSHFYYKKEKKYLY